jgi:HK97 family phage prohead protease
MTNTQAERAAAAALYWARETRRDDESIRGAVAHLGPEDLTETRAILAAGTLANLSDEQLIERMVGLAVKVLEVERKSVMVQAPPDTGSFTGYLAVIGNRDLQGDVIGPVAMDATVADFQAGKLRWFITDSHSDRASDAVAEVAEAALDPTGLLIKAGWLATEQAQTLRAMVAAGVRLGLSIDYLPVAFYPDGQGRVLTDITIVGGALTPKPANPLAVVIEGKSDQHPAVDHRPGQRRPRAGGGLDPGRACRVPGHQCARRLRGRAARRRDLLRHRLERAHADPAGVRVRAGHQGPAPRLASSLAASTARFGHEPRGPSK